MNFHHQSIWILSFSAIQFVPIPVKHTWQVHNFVCPDTGVVCFLFILFLFNFSTFFNVSAAADTSRFLAFFDNLDIFYLNIFSFVLTGSGCKTSSECICDIDFVIWCFLFIFVTSLFFRFVAVASRFVILFGDLFFFRFWFLCKSNFTFDLCFRICRFCLQLIFNSVF